LAALGRIGGPTVRNDAAPPVGVFVRMFVMIDIRPATGHEMIAAFLQAEIDSSRFRRYFPDLDVYHPRGRALIEAPNFNDAAENVARGHLLAYRGYPAAALFDGFPAGATWHLVRLELQDFVRMRCAYEPTLIALSAASRLVSDAARRFARGVPAAAPFQHIWDIVAKLRAGGGFAQLIAAQDADGSLTLIEGHSRAIAYVITGFQDNILTFAARAPTFAGWRYRGSSVP
jgi:hypothetical protein